MLGFSNDKENHYKNKGIEDVKKEIESLKCDVESIKRHEEILKTTIVNQVFIERLKKKFIEDFEKSKDDWGHHTGVALEMMLWLKENLPFSEQEKDKIFPKKTEITVPLTKEEKKKRKHWFRWHKKEK